jgi:hypothetical protein
MGSVQNESINDLAKWDFRTQHVQRELEPQDFVNASTVLVAAGPPRIVSPGELAGTTGGAEQRLTAVNLFPIGVVENMTIVSNRQLQILFEIGSKRQFYIPGRVIPQITLARTLFNGPNILRALYAYYPVDQLAKPNFPLVQTSRQAFKEIFACKVQEQPGFTDFWANMNSDLFDRPFGLLMLLKDQCNRAYGSVYLENAFINNHQISVNASSTLVAEGTTIQFERMVPVDIGAKPASAKTGSDVSQGILVE